jgi:predicted TIM-barrel fold metal-dependent hydrolase
MRTLFASNFPVNGLKASAFLAGAELGFMGAIGAAKAKVPIDRNERTKRDIIKNSKRAYEK